MILRPHGSTWALFFALTPVFFAILSTASMPVLAGELDEQLQDRDDETIAISSIDIQGLERTRESVVLNELTLAPGQDVTEEDLIESRRRLRNLPLFRQTTFDLQDTDGDGQRLVISVDERWTLLPSANFSTTDDTTLLRLGAREINLMGRYIELGAAYERLTGLHSGEIWFRNPRLRGRTLDVAVDAQYRNRIYPSYDDEGAIDGGFAIRRISLSSEALHEISPWIHLGARFQALSDQPSLDPVGATMRDAQQQRGLPPSSRLFRPGLLARIGQMNQLGLVMGGITLDLQIDGASQSLGSTDSFLAADAVLRGAISLPYQSNLLTRLRLGRTGAASPQHQLYIGGLDEVRAFPDMRFRGSHRWYANAEYRIPSLGNEWVTLQHVFFVDAGAIGDATSDLRGLDALSTGLGLRLKSPRIHGLALRFDLALSLHGGGDAPFGFGSRQFF